MGDIAQRGNRLTFARGLHVKKEGVGKPLRGIKLTKRKYEPIQNKALVRDVYEHVAHKHSLGQKKKPHSSKEGRTASAGRALRDVGKIFGSERVGKFGGGRTNLLEELGRVEAEPSNRNRRAEISRVHGELNRGYAIGGVVKALKRAIPKPKGPKKPKSRDSETHGKDVRTMAAEGGRIGKAIGGWMLKKPVQKLLEGIGGGSEGKPHSTRAGRISAGARRIKRGVKKAKREDKAEGGRIGLKKGGSDKKWIQKAVNPKHKGYCTPMTKKTCTPARKALARTFKKKAKTGWG